MDYMFNALLPASFPQAAAIEATAPDGWSRDDLAREFSSGCGRLFGLWTVDLGEPIGDCPPSEQSFDVSGQPFRHVHATLCGVAVFQVAAGEAELLSITVAPAARGQGAGRALLQQALGLLADEGCSRCFLEVRSQNEAALALYESRGFCTVGQRRGFYKDPPDDALVMALSLAPLPASI